MEEHTLAVMVELEHTVDMLLDMLELGNPVLVERILGAVVGRTPLMGVHLELPGTDERPAVDTLGPAERIPVVVDLIPVERIPVERSRLSGVQIN